jgi:hypothetical protein
MATIFQILQFFDGNGAPLDSGKVYWYEAGTSTPKDTWVDESESATAANPVRLDNQGRPDHGSGPAAMWLRGSYKMKLTDSLDNEIVTIDDINLYNQLDWTGLTASIADLNSTKTTAVLKNSTYTIQLGDRGKTILADATSGAFVINLPTAASVGNTFKIIIKKIDNSLNAINIQPAGSETVDFRSPFLLSDYFDFIQIHSDGSSWHIVAAQIRGTVKIVTTTATIALEDNNKLINCDASGGAFDVNLPSAATVGKGWRLKIKKIDSSGNIVTVKTSGAEELDGNPTLGISTQYFAVSIVSDGAADYYIESEYGDTASGGAYPYGYLRDVLLEQDSGDPAHDIKFNKGAARSEDNTSNLTLISPLVKRTDASWQQGTNNGGFPNTISIALETFYHCFLIGKPDGTTDAGFDSAVDASNLLADTNVIAAGFTKYKRVGAIRTKKTITDIDDFSMTILPGGSRLFYWKDAANKTDSHVISVTTPITRPIIVPNGIITLAHLAVYLDSNDSHLDINAKVYALDEPDPTGALPKQWNVTATTIGGANSAGASDIFVRTDTSSQVQFRATRTGSLTRMQLTTRGWME